MISSILDINNMAAMDLLFWNKSLSLIEKKSPLRNHPIMIKFSVNEFYNALVILFF